MSYDVVIEIPKGSRNKYEVDHETGRVFLDRVLFTPSFAPRVARRTTLSAITRQQSRRAPSTARARCAASLMDSRGALKNLTARGAQV